MVSDLWKIPVRPQSLALRAKEMVLKLLPPRRMCCLSRGDAAAFLRSVPGGGRSWRPPSLVGFLCRAHYVGQWLLGSAYSSKPHARLLMVSVSAEGTHTGFLGCLEDTHRKSLRYEKSKEHLENRVFQPGTMLKKNLNTYEIQDLPSYVYFPVRG